MKNLDSKKVTWFLEYRKANKDTVFNLLVFNLFVSLFVFLLGYDFFKSFLVLLPVVVIGCLIFIIFKILKKYDDKTVNIFCGIEGLLLTIICQCGIFLLFPMSLNVVKKWLLISILVNLVVAISVNIFCIFYLRGKKSVADKPISIAGISVFSILGIIIGREINNDNKIIIVFIIFSAVSSILSVYFLKYKLEKMLTN